MSSDSWEEVVSSSSSAHSEPEVDGDNNKEDRPAVLVVSDANVDAAGAGLSKQVFGGLTLFFVLGLWITAVSG